MIKVTKVERSGKAALIYMDVKGYDQPYIYILRIGLLESYQGVYGINDPMDAMRLMLIDGVIDVADSSVAATEDPDAETKTAEMIKKHQSKINWNGFFDQIRELATMDDVEEAEMMKESWRLHRQNLLREADRVLPTKKEKAARQADLGEGFRRLREERLADSMVAELPLSSRRQPRAPYSGTVGFSLNI